MTIILAILKHAAIWILGTALGRGILLALNSRGYHPEKWVKNLIGGLIPKRSKGSAIYWILAGAFGLLLMITWDLGHVSDRLARLLPTETTARNLPGFAAYAVLRIYDIPEYRRKYIFDFGSEGSKARAAFYLSASDKFTFLVTDVRGESYPLEVKLGQDGIPIDRFIMLSCEAGTEEEATILRVSVNGKEIQRRRLSFPIDFGSRKWGPGSALGANFIGQDNGIFVLVELAVRADTFSETDLEKLFDNVAQFYKLK